MKFDLRKRVAELLSANPGKRYKARDIAVWITETYPEASAAKLEKSASLHNHTQLLNQIVAEIGANRPQWQRQMPQLRTTEGVRPRLFYWTEKSERQEVEEVESGGSGHIEVDIDVAEHSVPTQVEKV